jgi:hypothetical protein
MTVSLLHMDAIATAQQVTQQDNLCFIRTESGQEVVLNRLCGISTPHTKEQKPVSKQRKYPVKVEGFSSVVVLDGKEPQTLPNGDIVYPDGTVRMADGSTVKVKFKDGVVEDLKYYDKHGKLIN